MSNNVYTSTECPCCQKKANSTNEIQQDFGFRNMGDGRNIPQSYCKDCRSSGCKAGSPCKCKDK